MTRFERAESEIARCQLTTKHNGGIDPPKAEGIAQRYFAGRFLGRVADKAAGRANRSV